MVRLTPGTSELGARDFRVVVSVDTSKITNMIDNYIMAFTRNLKMGLKNISKVYALAYLKHIRESGIQRDTGYAEDLLIRQIEEPLVGRAGGVMGRGEFAKLGQRLEGTYQVVVPNYMIALDRFKQQPHIVALKSGRGISRWYERTFGMKPLAGVNIPAAMRRPGKFFKRKTEEIERRVRNAQREGKSYKDIEKIRSEEPRQLIKYFQIMKVKRHPWIDSANQEARQYILSLLLNVRDRTRAEVKGV